MTRAGFEIVEHTADTGVRGRAADLPSLFAVMAEGLFAVIASPEKIGSGRERVVRLHADSLEALLHDWLEELNSLHQIHGELYREFEVRLDGLALEATIRGEALDPDRHDLRVEVKAVTWHGLTVESATDPVEAFVLLDI